MTARRAVYVPWALALIVAVVAYAAVVRPSEVLVARDLERARHLTAQAMLIENTLHRQVEIRSAAKRVTSEIVEAAAYGDAGNQARLVRAISRAAIRSGTGIVSVTPASLDAPVAGEGRYLRAQDAAIGIRGSYAALALFVQYLCAQDALVAVRDVHISRLTGKPSANTHVLDAQIDVQLYSFKRSALKTVL